MRPREDMSRCSYSPVLSSVVFSSGQMNSVHGGWERKGRGWDLDCESASKAVLSACHSLCYLFSEPQQQDGFEQVEDGQGM